MMKIFVGLSILACSVIAVHRPRQHHKTNDKGKNDIYNAKDEFNKAFPLAKTSPVEVIDEFVKGNNYTDYVIDEFNKVFESDKLKTRHGIHSDIIRKMGDKFGGFWGASIGISENPRTFYIDMDWSAGHKTAPDFNHIVMRKGNFVLYVYYLKIDKPINNQKLNESQAIPTAPQLNGVPDVNNSNVEDKNSTKEIRYEVAEDIGYSIPFDPEHHKAVMAQINAAQDEFNKAYAQAKTSPVVVVDEIVKGNNYTEDAIFAFNRAFASDKYDSSNNMQNYILKRLGLRNGGFWGVLVGLSEKPRQFYFGMDLVKSNQPDHYHAVMHKGSFILYVYHIKIRKNIWNVNQNLNVPDTQPIDATRQWNGVLQMTHSNVKGNNNADNTEYEYNKVFVQTKNSTVEVISDGGWDYTHDVKNEFNKVFASDKFQSPDGIHYDVIRRLGEKFGGFWGGLVGISEKPRLCWHVATDVETKFYVVMKRGSVVLYVYYLQI